MKLPAPFRTVEEMEAWYLSEGFLKAGYLCAFCGTTIWLFVKPGSTLPPHAVCPECRQHHLKQPNNHNHN